MTTARRRRLAALLKASGVPDVDPALVDPAFVHQSAASEGHGSSNDRLEFLGDAVLGYATSRWLMSRYPEAREGELTRRKAYLVSYECCAETARRLGLGQLVILGVGMSHTGGADNTSILADTFEAYLGALAEQIGVERVSRFIEQEHLLPHQAPEEPERDAKSALQELAQAYFRLTPMYFERAEGPAADRRFTSQVRIGEEIVGEGIGPSKKAAQQSAAAMALAHLRTRYPEPPEPTRPTSPGGRPPAKGEVIALRPSRRTPKSTD